MKSINRFRRSLAAPRAATAAVAAVAALRGAHLAHRADLAAACGAMFEAFGRGAGDAQQDRPRPRRAGDGHRPPATAGDAVSRFVVIEVVQGAPKHARLYDDHAPAICDAVTCGLECGTLAEREIRADLDKDGYYSTEDGEYCVAVLPLAEGV